MFSESSHSLFKILRSTPPFHDSLFIISERITPHHAYVEEEVERARKKKKYIRIRDQYLFVIEASNTGEFIALVPILFFLLVHAYNGESNWVIDSDFGTWIDDWNRCSLRVVLEHKTRGEAGVGDETMTNTQC